MLSCREATVGTVGVTMIVNMITTCVNAINICTMTEPSRSPQTLESSDISSSVELEEHVSIVPLVATP